MSLYLRFGSGAAALGAAGILGACAGLAYEYEGAYPMPRSAARAGWRAAPAGVEYRAHLTSAADEGASGPGLRAVVSRVDPGGERTWTRACVGSGALSEPRVAASADGGGLLAITFQGRIDCGTGPVVAAGGAEDFDGLLVALDPTGRVRWMRSAGDLGVQALAAVAVDPWGSVVIAGSFEGTIDLGGPPLTAETERDVLLAKLDADGDFVWQRRFGIQGRNFGVDVDIASNGRIVLLSRGASDIDFGPGPLSAKSTAGFVTVFDAGGGALWSHGLSSTGEVFPEGLRVGPDNRIVVAGSFTGTADFGGGTVDSAGRTDVFVARFDDRD
jgi:hypothetical protein